MRKRKCEGKCSEQDKRKSTVRHKDVKMRRCEEKEEKERNRGR